MVRLRPTFALHLEEPRLEVMEKLRQSCEQLNQRHLFLMYGEYGELHLPAEEHRLWSPHLSFYVIQRDAASMIHARFAPRPDVWTSVWIAYLAMAFTAFFGFALGYSQWMLGETVWGLWVAIAASGVIGGLYLVASIGQQWSSDQMLALRSRLESILQTAGVRISPHEHSSSVC